MTVLVCPVLASQVACCFIVTITVTTPNVLGLPFLVLGLWQLGFPETIATLRSADTGTLRTTNFMRGLAVLLHHSVIVWTVCNTTQGLYDLGRPVWQMALPPLIQHWVCLLKPSSVVSFVIVLVVLEIWWEIEVFTNIEVRMKYQTMPRHV